MITTKSPSLLILVVTIIGSLGNLVVSGVMSFILVPEVFKDYFLIVSFAQIVANVVHFGGSNYYAYLIAQRVDRIKSENFIFTHSYLVIPALGGIASYFLYARFPEVPYVSLLLLLASFALQGITRTKLLLNERYVRAIVLGVLNILTVIISILLYHFLENDLGFLFALQGVFGLVLFYYFLGINILDLHINYIGGSLTHMFYSMLNSFFVSMCMTGDRLLVDSLKPLDGILYSYSSMIFGYFLILANYSAGLWTNLLTLSYRKDGNLKNNTIKRHERVSFSLAALPVVLAVPTKFFIDFVYNVELGFLEAVGFGLIVGLNIVMKFYLAILNILGAPRVFSLLCSVSILILLVIYNAMEGFKLISDLLALVVCMILIVVSSLSYYTKSRIYAI